MQADKYHWLSTVPTPLTKSIGIFGGCRGLTAYLFPDQQLLFCSYVDDLRPCFFTLFWCNLKGFQVPTLSASWMSRKRCLLPELLVTIVQTLPLHPTSLHPNPMDICLCWISVLSSPAQPCLLGNWVDEYMAYKLFPVWITLSSKFQRWNCKREVIILLEIRFTTPAQDCLP